MLTWTASIVLSGSKTPAESDDFAGVLLIPFIAILMHAIDREKSIFPYIMSEEHG